jgi:hypothetical protein
LLTASIPVYVPPPSVNARNRIIKSDTQPIVETAVVDCSLR